MEEEKKGCVYHDVDTSADWGPESKDLRVISPLDSDCSMFKLVQFKEGLKKLFLDHDAFLINRELEYDGKYLQTNIHVTIDGKVWPDETFHDMLEEVLDEITEESGKE